MPYTAAKVFRSQMHLLEYWAVDNSTYALMQWPGNSGLLYKPIIMLYTAAKVFRSQMHLLEYWAAV